MTDDDKIDAFLHDASFAAWHAKITTIIAQHGHQLIGVFGTETDPGPGFLYTIGLTRKLGYELIAFGLPYYEGGMLLNAIVKELRSGEDLELGVPVNRWGLLLPVMFVEADDRARGYVCQADRYFQKDVRTIQLVLPDREGRFPGNAEYDGEYMNPRQPLLYDPTVQ